MSNLNTLFFEYLIDMFFYLSIYYMSKLKYLIDN